VRLESHGSPPFDGITRGGYTLIYSDTPSDYFKKIETRRKITDLTYSLGFVVGKENKLTSVLWGSRAHAAGLTAGTQIVAVNGVAYDSDRLQDVVKGATTDPAAIEFLVKNGDRYGTARIDYHDGLRYPHLKCDPSVPALLDQILEPRG
jgi:predicted metalloprotease with PDZ domain